jgi:predicted DNA-binding protein
MSDEEPEMKEALESLSRRALQIGGPKAVTLGHAIERVLETFYPG